MKPAHPASSAAVTCSAKHSKPAAARQDGPRLLAPLGDRGAGGNPCVVIGHQFGVDRERQLQQVGSGGREVLDRRQHDRFPFSRGRRARRRAAPAPAGSRPGRHSASTSAATARCAAGQRCVGMVRQQQLDRCGAARGGLLDRPEQRGRCGTRVGEVALGFERGQEADARRRATRRRSAAGSSTRVRASRRSRAARSTRTRSDLIDVISASGTVSGAVGSRNSRSESR